MQPEESSTSSSKLTEGMFEFNRMVIDISRLNKVVPIQFRQTVFKCIQEEILQIPEINFEKEMWFGDEKERIHFRCKLSEFILHVDLSELSEF